MNPPLADLRPFMKPPLCLVLLLAVVPSGLAAASPAHPNVLFIAVDDMRDWAGFMGHAQAVTPNFDRLAKQGMSFTRAYTASALCNPSRTALLTGLRPGTSGVYRNNDDWRAAVPAEVPSIPGYFHRHGYRTLGVGKIFHGGKLRREDWDEYHKDQEREESDNVKKDWSLKTELAKFLPSENKASDAKPDAAKLKPKKKAKP